MSNLHLAPPSLADAFAGNRLLSTFPDELREMVESRIEMVDLDLGKTVLRRGGEVAHSLFPFGPTMISMAVDLADGRTGRSGLESAAKARSAALSAAAMCPHSRGPK